MNARHQLLKRLGALLTTLRRTTGEKLAAAAAQGASVVMRFVAHERLRAHGVYTVECVGADGALKWRDTAVNLVTTAGKNDLEDKYLAGSAYTAAFYMLLVDSTGYTTGAAAGDTMGSHAGWAEATPYSNATRPAVSWNAASGGSKASTATAFNVNASATVKGCGLTTNSTKGGTTGTLFSAGLFTGGDRTVANGDTLNVTYTLSA